MQLDDVVLDCRPNNRSTRVRLLDNLLKEIPLGLNADTGQTLRWAPALGFTLGPLRFRDGGVYSCRADGGDMEDLMLVLDVLHRSTKLWQPEIYSMEAVPHAVLGKSLELRCSVLASAHTFFDMEWLLPANSTAEAEGRAKVSSPRMEDFSKVIRMGSTDLTVVNLTESDAGAYTCRVTEYTLGMQYATFHLPPSFLEVKSVQLQVLEHLGDGAGGGARGGELQLAAGEPLRLRCEGPGRLRWNFPQPDEAEGDAAPAPLLTEEALSGGRWRADLHLPSASYFHTGFYNCSLAADAPANACASVYVYVADPEYPWVRGGLVATWAMQLDDAIFDCRPNNRSTHVRLLDHAENEIPLGLNKYTGRTLRWAPALGFTLGPLAFRDAGVYFCKADGGDLEDLMLMLNVKPRTTNLSPPEIHTVEALPHAVLGRSLELRCSVRASAQTFFHMDWLLPANSTAEAEGRANESSPMAEHLSTGFRVGSANLTVANLTETDAGAYTCRVTDHANAFVESTVHVEVNAQLRPFERGPSINNTVSTVSTVSTVAGVPQGQAALPLRLRRVAEARDHLVQGRAPAERSRKPGPVPAGGRQPHAGADVRDGGGPGRVPLPRRQPPGRRGALGARRPARDHKLSEVPIVDRILVASQPD